MPKGKYGVRVKTKGTGFRISNNTFRTKENAEEFIASRKRKIKRSSKKIQKKHENLETQVFLRKTKGKR